MAKSQYEKRAIFRVSYTAGIFAIIFTMSVLGLSLFGIVDMTDHSPWE
jgi:ABC-type nitrate/sulfonate/bicarbonate transport system permease component